MLLARALADLPEAQREAVTLHYLQGWPLAEIAGHLGRSPSAVMGLLHRGLKQLRARLRELE
jgi:RNA polymerase sigma-70 factor (ECF subfamily)